MWVGFARVLLTPNFNLFVALGAIHCALFIFFAYFKCLHMQKNSLYWLIDLSKVSLIIKNNFNLFKQYAKFKEKAERYKTIVWVLFDDKMIPIHL